ncbi:MAG: hypothetical protein ACR2NG_08840 [Acidimicrobiia bacterium]
MKRMTRLIVATSALTAVMAVPLSAQAQEAETDTTRRHSIDQIKERAQAAIERRLDTLDRLTDRVESAQHVSDSHKATLIGDYRAAANGLTGLGVEIAAATTAEELKVLVPLIASDYRVYLVIVPKSLEVAASDRIGVAVDRLTNAANRLEDAIDRAEDAGVDTTQAERWLISARDEIAEAKRTGVPVADDVIGLDASDWEEPAKSMLQEGKRRLDNARVDVRQAHGSLTKGAAALRDAING